MIEKIKEICYKALKKEECEHNYIYDEYKEKFICVYCLESK